jgi:hypothetical protein
VRHSIAACDVSSPPGSSGFALLFLATLNSAAQVNHFFPRGAHLATITGVLTNWSHGEAVGSPSVKDHAGSIHTFSMGYPPKINGSVVTCFRAPAHGTPDRISCTDWPTSVVINSTNVKVTDWSATSNGVLARASDKVDSR